MNPSENTIDNQPVRLHKSKYLESVHVLRGIAAFLVVCEHIVGRPPYALFNQYFGWLDNLGSYGVAVFFVISGFILPYSFGENYTLKGYGQFLLRRLLRIEPVYFASIIISCFTVAILTRLAPNGTPYSISLITLIYHFFYLIPFTEEQWILPVYWTLAVEFQFYIIIGLLYPWFRSLCSQNTLNLSLIPLILSLFVFIAPFCKPLQLIQYIPYFALGIFCAMLYRQKLSNLNVVTTLTVLTTIVVISGTNLYAWLIGIITFFTILFWHPDSLSNHVMGRILLFLGTISYSWYATHQLLASVGESLSRFLLRLDFLPLQLLWVNLVPVFIFLFSILFAYCLYVFIELPAHKLARNIKYK
jgi:peptidoglycan/LPS O-acetylase OafA/YrhL